VLPENVKVYLNGEKIEIQNFSEYVDMYLEGGEKQRITGEVQKIEERKYHKHWDV